MNIATVSGTTPDPQEELLNKLRDLVPSAFPDGFLDQAALLRSLDLSTELKPSFSFTWPGIEQARREARAATSATLAPDQRASVNWETSRDVLIEGDNLQVLKILKAGYSNAAKLIYIDPPYNTGDSFTYNDDFAVPESEYLRATGQVDEQGNATTSKIEKGGRKHAPWLTMMFSRMVTARHLLTRDGVILVSIDNNEVHHLRLLLDAVFGARNFVDMMTWRGARKGDAKLTGGGQDYILVYARDREYLKANNVHWREHKSGLEPIYAKERGLRAEYGGDYTSATTALQAWYNSLPDEDPSKAHKHYRVVDHRGIYFPGDIASPNPRPNLVYEWKGYAIPENGWRYERSKMKELDADDRLVYPDSKEKRIQVKRYLHEHEEWAPASVFYKDRRAASGALKNLMGAEMFDNPKDPDVLARLFHVLTDEGDLIVDFFAGSGSTGQAVWGQNANDGKIRHWLLVQIPEAPNEKEKTGKKAVAAGYKTIFELTAERLRRNSAQAPERKLGFRIFRTQPTNLIVEPPVVATSDTTGDSYVQTSLKNTQAPPVLEGADPFALAWEIVLKTTATRLDAQVKKHALNGVTIYEFIQFGTADQEGRLLVCLDSFDLSTANALNLTDSDTLIVRGDKVDDSTTLTLAPRLQSKLVLLERIPREVSL